MGRVVADYVYSKSKPAADLDILFDYELGRNHPGYSMIGLHVKFPPSGATAPHRHNGATVVAKVLSGTVYNKMNDDPTMLLESGETWYEAPGCHHKTSANASNSEDALILATLIIETKLIKERGYAALVEIDEEWR